MSRILSVVVIFSFIFIIGCAAGGGGLDADYGGERSGTTVQDSRGFDKELGPEEIAYQSAQQFLSAGNYTEA
ncbi:MAG: hypothetical protein JXB45_05585, partial [Candidatus Krumholzibacteriota bacterium]|nr:hypothetical protein [Candidatus Krumholzibacteriota bacterium]